MTVFLLTSPGGGQPEARTDQERTCDPVEPACTRRAGEPAAQAPGDERVATVQIRRDHPEGGAEHGELQRDLARRIDELGKEGLMTREVLSAQGQ